MLLNGNAQESHSSWNFYIKPEGEGGGVEGSLSVTCWIGAKSRPLSWVQRRAFPSQFLPLTPWFSFILSPALQLHCFDLSWKVSGNENKVISGAADEDTVILWKLSLQSAAAGRRAASKEVAFRAWRGGLWWPFLLFAKGSVKSRPLADFWIIAFQHFHYVTASSRHLRKIFLFSPKSRRSGPRISCGDSASFFLSLFSCPEQLNRWPCPLVPWSVRHH